MKPVFIPLGAFGSQNESHVFLSVRFQPAWRNRNEEVAYNFFIFGMGNTGFCDSYGKNSRQRGDRQFAGVLLRHGND